MRRSLPLLALASALCACGGDFAMTVSGPSQPVAADGQSPAAIEIRVSQGDTPIDASRNGSIAFSTDVGSLVPIDLDGGESPYPELSNQMSDIPVTGGPVSVPLYSALPGTAHIQARYTDGFGGFAIARTTVTFQ